MLLKPSATSFHLLLGFTELYLLSQNRAARTCLNQKIRRYQGYKCQQQLQLVKVRACCLETVQESSKESGVEGPQARITTGPKGV